MVGSKIGAAVVLVDSSEVVSFPVELSVVPGHCGTSQYSYLVFLSIVKHQTPEEPSGFLQLFDAVSSSIMPSSSLVKLLN